MIIIRLCYATVLCVTCLCLLVAGVADGQKLCSYKVEVKTSNCRGAGTDANVNLTAFGTLGDTGSHALDSHINNFERNTLDTFFISVGHAW